MRRSTIDALPVLTEGCPGVGWAGSCTGAGLEHSSGSWLLSRTNPDVLFCALKDISSLLSQVKRSWRKQVPNSSPYRSAGQYFPISTVSADKPCSLLCVLHWFLSTSVAELEALLLCSGYLPGAKCWLCEHPVCGGFSEDDWYRRVVQATGFPRGLRARS